MSARHIGARARYLAAAALGSVLAFSTPGAIAQTAAPAAEDSAAPEKPATEAPTELEKQSGAVLTWINQEANNQDVFKFDFAVPSSPALTLIGEDLKIPQSNSLRPFVLALPNLFTAKESGQSAGLEISPAWLFVRGEDRTFSAHKRRPLLYRTRIGVALYEGVNNTDPAKQKPSRASIGLSTSLLPYSDPILAVAPGQDVAAWEACLQTVPWDLLAAAQPAKEPQILTDARATEKAAQHSYDLNKTEQNKQKLRKAQGEVKVLEAAEARKLQTAYASSDAAQAIPACMKVADRAARTGFDLDLGGGAVWDGQPGKLSGLKDPSAVFWGSLRMPLGVSHPTENKYEALVEWAKKNDHWFMIGGAGRVAFSELVPTGDAAKPKIRANTYSGWIGLERYSETSRFALQLGLRRTDPRLAADSSFAGTQTVYSASFDQEVVNGIWLTVSYGKANGTGALKDDSTAKVSLVFTAPDARKIFGD